MGSVEKGDGENVPLPKTGTKGVDAKPTKSTKILASELVAEAAEACVPDDKRDPFSTEILPAVPPASTSPTLESPGSNESNEDEEKTKKAMSKLDEMAKRRKRKIGHNQDALRPTTAILLAQHPLEV